MTNLTFPALRAWLKTTRLPGLRRAAQAERLVRRVRRLGRTEQALADLQAHCAGLVARLADADARLVSLDRHVRDTDVYRKRMEDFLRDQLDLAKSAREVPREWFDEYRRWRAENPPPEEPLVSVCVATYNRGRLLTERCVASLLRQTWRKLEVVVVGDGCTDDTADRMAALNDPRVRFVNLPERGRYPQEPRRRWEVAGSIPMNHALGLCTGDYVTHLDDDDEHEPDRVAKLVAFARENDLDFVWHPFWLEARPNEWELRPCEEFRLGFLTTSSIFYRRWFTRIGWDVCSHLLEEPGDWNRLRKFKYLGVKAGRYPEPLLRHYVERSQAAG